MKDNFNPLLKETFVFRPFNGGEGRGIIVTTNKFDHAMQGVLRYAEGQWIPDDGEYDLAFASGVFAFGVSLPDYTNAIWSWLDMDLTKKWLPERLYKYASWHHSCTINNTPFDQKCHWDKRQHPNEIAMKSAMDKVCSIQGCANGSGANLTSEGKRDVPWVAEKRILIKSTMQPVLIPENPICYKCLDNGKGHLIEALQSYKEQLESNIEYAQEAINKDQINIYDNEDVISKATEGIPRITGELKELGVS